MSDPRPTLPELARFNQHFAERIVPLWQGPGWNADMALPYEALEAGGIGGARSLATVRVLS